MGIFDRLRGMVGSDASRRDPERPSRVDRVAPWLLIGPALLIEQYADLRRRGVTHILDLREEASDDADALNALGFRWRRMPVPDRRAPSHEQLMAIIEWLDSDADPNTDQALYIHCHAGMGRTPTLAMALLMQHDLSLGEAHRLVRAARPEASPTAHQQEWLEEVASRRAAARAKQD